MKRLLHASLRSALSETRAKCVMPRAKLCCSDEVQCFPPSSTRCAVCGEMRDHSSAFSPPFLTPRRVKTTILNLCREKFGTTDAFARWFARRVWSILWQDDCATLQKDSDVKIWFISVCTMREMQSVQSELTAMADFYSSKR